MISYKSRPNAKDFIQVEILVEKNSQKIILIGKVIFLSIIIQSPCSKTKTCFVLLNLQVHLSRVAKPHRGLLSGRKSVKDTSNSCSARYRRFLAEESFP